MPPARRWDRCFIRLLDGMLQVIGFADADGDDHALRIPVRIRGIEIGAPAGSGAPALPCAVERARGRVTTPLASITGLELAAAPRSAASSNTKCAPVSWLIASTAEPCAGLGQPQWWASAPATGRRPHGDRSVRPALACLTMWGSLSEFLMTGCDHCARAPAREPAARCAG